MNKSLLSFACASIFALTALAAHASEETPFCTLATLRGTWAFGFAATRAGLPYSSSGTEAYDGQGRLNYLQLWSNGFAKQTWVGTGTYSITANCIATVIYDGDVAHPYTYFVAPDGSAYYWNNNLGTGVVSAGRVDRISRAPLPQ